MKKIIILFLSLIIMLGANGCMSSKNDLNSIKNSISSYLNEKYNCKFEIVKITEEFSGNRGFFYRLVCKSDKYSDLCIVYCHTDEGNNGTPLIIGSKEYLVTDNYANIVFQSEYTSLLQDILGDDVLIKCQLKTPNYILSDSEFASGLKNCLENPEVPACMYTFIFADNEKVETNLKSSTEFFLEQYNMYKQYLYVCYQNDINFETWNTLYYDNYSEFIAYLLYKSDIDRVEYSSFDQNKGLVRSTIEKE